MAIFMIIDLNKVGIY